MKMDLPRTPTLCKMLEAGKVNRSSPGWSRALLCLWSWVKDVQKCKVCLHLNEKTVGCSCDRYANATLCLCLNAPSQARSRFTTAQTREMASQAIFPVVLNGGVFVAVWGHSVGGQLLFPFFLRMRGRQDRLWRQPLWLWSSSLPLTRTLLPLLHPKGNAHGATSALTVLSEEHNWVCDFICRVQIFWHIYTRDRRLAGPTQLSCDTGLTPRAWGQDVGLGDKSYFSMHMSAASVHLASALTFVVQRAFIQKQLCELRCCCITGSVSQKPTTQHSHFLLPAGILCRKP